MTRKPQNHVDRHRAGRRGRCGILSAARRWGPTACPVPELVQASHTGVLPPELQQRVAAHVALCVVCQALVDALDD